MLKHALLLASIMAMPVTAYANDHRDPDRTSDNRDRTYDNGDRTYDNRDDNRTYRGRSQYQHCRRSSGTAGLVAGGVGGAVLGGSVIGGGIAGPLLGGVAGALGGRAVDRSMTANKRCR